LYLTILLLSVVSSPLANAQQVAQCHVPLPVLKLEELASGENEFGLRVGQVLDSIIPPDKVMMRTSTHVIGADYIEYRQQEKTAEAQGNVTIVSEAYRLDADYAKVIVDEDYVELTKSKMAFFEVDSEDPKTRYQSGRGSAEGIRVEDGVLYLESSEFTHCPEGVNDIALAASDISLNPKTRQGIARNTIVRFKDVPVFSLPYVRFPIGSERLSGFLFPKISASSKLGSGITMPYYFNLAPNQDATLTPKYYSKRGFQLEAEYRYLGIYSDLNFIGEYMPRDKRYKPNKEDKDQDKRRYGAELTGNLHDGGSLYSNFEVGWVSDRSYIDDYSGGFSDNDRDYLVQNASVSYANYGLVLSAGVNKFINSQKPVVDNKKDSEEDDDSGMDLDNRLEDHTEERSSHNREPWFSVDYIVPLTANSAFKTNMAWDKFSHKEKPDAYQDAHRFRGESALSMQIANSYAEVDLEVGAEYLRYKLENPKYNDRNEEKRTANKMSVNSTYASLDGRLYFDRSSNNGSSSLWTLVPRVKLLATNRVKQDELPQFFDTTVAKMDSYERLFQDTPYIGGDHLRDTNQISVGPVCCVFSTHRLIVECIYRVRPSLLS